MLLEKPAAQDRLGRQTVSPGLLDVMHMPAQILRHEPDNLSMLVQPPRLAFSSRPIS
jgi:hypothetical protein